MYELMREVQLGFDTLHVGNAYKIEAIRNIGKWLTDPIFVEYVPQIKHLIEKKHWDYLLDSFYQVIPFGTGGRRGEVGIGPNRINRWTIQSSAQGHSQYLIKHYGEEAKTRGVVLAWDVREFYGNEYFSVEIANPVLNLIGDKLAMGAAEVYVANGIKVYMFDGIRTTPELSFAVRYLKAVGGDVFSASHNPPSHNGKKVYDETGGQLVPPDDEALVKEVTEGVGRIKTRSFETIKNEVQFLGNEIDEAYINAACALSLSSERKIKVAYTPMHGCGSTSILKVMVRLGFDVKSDPETSNQSGHFEHITFNIPNPEVTQSFDTPVKFAKEIDADILLNSDPDADRIGVMVKHQGSWKFLTGNEIAAILTQYVIEKRKETSNGVMIKTEVTTNLLREIAAKNNVRLIGDLLVGFKYIGVEMNKLEKSGEIGNFIFGAEESHGYIAGNYTRDKDACVAAIWLSELAAELKLQRKTLVDYLQNIYSRYGYFGNYLTEIRLPGAEGRNQIDRIQDSLRSNTPKTIGRFSLEKVEDFLDRLPIVSETDRSSKNMMAFHFATLPGTISIKVTVRPSGTEPKSKMYIEIGSNPFEIENFENIQKNILSLIKELEKDFMKYCYKVIGVDFPDRGFLLFWQLPLYDKLKYFEIEPDLINLKDVPVGERRVKLDDLIKFLGSDPIAKFDDAFRAEYQRGVLEYLEIT